MGLFDKIKKPIFLNNVLGIQEDIKYLESILQVASLESKSKIEKDLTNLRYGLKGEQSIIYELKNSGIPMFVIQDLYLEHENMSAQIDFLVITRDKNYIIESKNMFGDILVCDNGDFLQKYGNKSYKIYSPITQCERHLEIIKKIRYNVKSNILTKYLFEKNFETNYLPLVVMANPNSKINTKYAPKSIKNKVIGVDQLVRFIKEHTNPRDLANEKITKELADFFLSANRENPKNYLNKYKELSLESSITSSDCVEKPPNLQSMKLTTDEILCSRCGSKMVLRIAKKGVNQGNEFYGCSSYPKCRNIKKIN